MTNNLTNYARFTKREHLDAAVQMHSAIHRHVLSKTDLVVFEMIHVHSADHFVAQLTQKAMEEELNLSRSTIMRCIRKLEKLKIVERIPYLRPDQRGLGLGATIYVILPIGHKRIQPNEGSDTVNNLDGISLPDLIKRLEEWT